MSQSTLALGNARTGPASVNDPTVVDGEAEVGGLLTVLDDADCRAILEATSDDSLSASQLSDECDIPTSTVYRKLELLTDAGLLTERTRVRLSGKHTHEYSRRVEAIEVSVDADAGFTLEVTHRADTDQFLGAPAVVQG